MTGRLAIRGQAPAQSLYRRHLAIFLLLLIVLCSGCDKGESSPAQTAAPARQQYQGKIVAMGDSLTAGYGVDEGQSYPAQLERKLHQAGYNWQVINAGISGETSSGALSRINWVLKLQPDIVILETGANDGLRGTDPALLRKNLDRLLEILKEKKVVVVLAGMKMVTNLGERYTASFAAVYPDVARRHKVIYVPFFLQGVGGVQSLTQQDGIHPTAEGYRLVTDHLYPYVVQAIRTKTEK